MAVSLARSTPSFMVQNLTLRVEAKRLVKVTFPRAMGHRFPPAQTLVYFRRLGYACGQSLAFGRRKSTRADGEPRQSKERRTGFFLLIRYRTFDKALPPRPVQLEIPGWAGTAERTQDGSEPQPWHCKVFVDAARYGLELVYQYDKECQVVNENGVLRFEWDYAREPGAQVSGGEFVSFFPKNRSRFYSFNTSLDIAAPPGFVMRTSPHPRFFSDVMGTVPIAVIGHLQTEWWSRMQIVVFKAPLPGQRHIFRKNEPYVQLLFVPQEDDAQLQPMNAEEAATRHQREMQIVDNSSAVAKSAWRNPAGFQFNDHYKVLARSFSRDGSSGVDRSLDEAAKEYEASLPPTISEQLDLAVRLMNEQNFQKAKTLLLHILKLEPDNVDAISRLGMVSASTELPMVAVEMFGRAVALQPNSALHLGNLGEMLRRVGRHPEASAALARALQIQPNDAQLMSNLGLALVQQGRLADGLALCEKAVAIDPKLAVARLRLGLALAQNGRIPEARESYRQAILIAPGYTEAHVLLQWLAGA